MVGGDRGIDQPGSAAPVLIDPQKTRRIPEEILAAV
jgi:hypothetical protein